MSPSDVGVSPSDVGVSPSDVGESLSDVGVSMSDVGVSMSDVGVSLSDMGVSPADVGVSMSDVGVSLSDVGVSLSDKRPISIWDSRHLTDTIYDELTEISLDVDWLTIPTHLIMLSGSESLPLGAACYMKTVFYNNGMLDFTLFR